MSKYKINNNISAEFLRDPNLQYVMRGYINNYSPIGYKSAYVT